MIQSNNCYCCHAHIWQIVQKWWSCAEDFRKFGLDLLWDASQDLSFKMKKAEVLAGYITGGYYFYNILFVFAFFFFSCTQSTSVSCSCCHIQMAGEYLVCQKVPCISDIFWVDAIAHCCRWLVHWALMTTIPVQSRTDTTSTASVLLKLISHLSEYLSIQFPYWCHIPASTMH